MRDHGYMLKASGGAIYFINGNVLELKNCSFVGNSAIVAGAVYAIPVANQYRGQLKMSNCLFVDNSALQAGVLYMGSAWSVTQYSNVMGEIESCSFVGNSAYDVGGAILVANLPLAIELSLFDGNSAFQGGAIVSFQV